MAKVASRDLSAISIDVRPGLIADDTAFKVGQAGWTEVDGVRVFRKGMETVRGFEFYNTGQFDGLCRGLFAWQDNDALVNVAIGTNEGLWVEVGGELADITPGDDPILAEDGEALLAEDGEPLLTESWVDGNEHGFGSAGYGTGGYGSGGYGSPGGGDTFPLTWTFGQYGEWLVACPRGRGIYYWQNNTDVSAKPVPNAPARAESILVTDRHIIAYGCSEELGGTFNPRCIRWCNFEDITDWTTATNNNAGEFILDNAGRIVRAMQVGSLIYVFTSDGVYVQQFVGQPGQTYFFDQVSSGCGLAGPNAVAVLGQTAYWMAPDRKFWMMPFGMAPMRLVSPTGRDVSDSLSAAQEEKVYGTTRAEFNEVRWYYPDDRDGDGLECSRYVAYNVAEKQWSAGNQERTAEIDRGVTQFPVATSPDGYIYLEERGFSGNGAALNRRCRTGFFYVAEGGRALSLRRLWPNFDDRQGTIRLTLYGRMEPDGAETSYGPYIVRPTDTVVDLGTEEGLPTAAMFALEWESETAPSFWRLGKITLNAVIRGRGIR